MTSLIERTLLFYMKFQVLSFGDPLCIINHINISTNKISIVGFWNNIWDSMYNKNTFGQPEYTILYENNFPI